MTFKQAVQGAPPPVNKAYRPGLQALGSESSKIQGRPRAFSGSIDLDSALRQARPNDCRWDYGIGVRRGHWEEAFWVEVHSADTRGGTEVLRKLQWLKEYLRREAPSLGAITRAEAPYIWIASGPVHIPRNTPQYRRLANSGLRGPLREYVLG